MVKRDRTGVTQQSRATAAARRKELDANRESSAKRGYGRKWAKARLAYLSQHPFCVKCDARGQLVPAGVVDHKQPHKNDPKLFWNPDNWQALCKSCHDRKTFTEDVALAPANSLTFEVILVAGAPGAGKNHYVQQNIKFGDAVIDLDALYAAISGMPMHQKPANLFMLVRDMRDYLYTQLEKRTLAISKAKRVWVITGQSGRTGRQEIAKRINADRVVIIDTPVDICQSRLLDRGVEAVKLCQKAQEWHRAYVPSPNDEIIHHNPQH